MVCQLQLLRLTLLLFACYEVLGNALLLLWLRNFAGILVSFVCMWDGYCWMQPMSIYHKKSLDLKLLTRWLWRTDGLHCCPSCCWKCWAFRKLEHTHIPNINTVLFFHVTLCWSDKFGEEVVINFLCIIYGSQCSVSCKTCRCHCFSAQDHLVASSTSITPQISYGDSFTGVFTQISSVRLRGQQDCLLSSFKLIHSNYTHPRFFILHAYKQQFDLKLFFFLIYFLNYFFVWVSLRFWLHWVLPHLAVAFTDVTGK